MRDRIKLEAWIGWPPTSKCQETVSILEECVRRHPDELRLLVFKRGIDVFPEEASQGMKNLMMKGNPVPACLVNGVLFVSCKVPDLEELEVRIQEVLLRTREDGT